MAEAVFSAVAESLEGMATRCTSRGMSFVLDEPPSLGGKDEGMNPLEAVLSALGACKCVVARAFAKPNSIRLRHVRVEVDGVFDPDGFRGKNPAAKVGLSKIRTRYHIDADNTPEEIAAFVEFIEAHCPVHDTLVNPPQLSYEIA